MSTDKGSRMVGASCTRAVLAACSDGDVTAMASTTLTTKKRGYWALTTVKPTAGCDQSDVFGAIASSRRVPAADVKIEGSLFTSTVKVWWKIKR